MALTQSSTRRSRRTPNRLELPFILLNPIMCRLLSSPLGRGLSGRLMVLTFQGRRSGRSFSLPVSYVVADGGLLVPGGGFWKRNFEGGREAQASLRGETGQPLRVPHQGTGGSGVGPGHDAACESRRCSRSALTFSAWS